MHEDNLDVYGVRKVWRQLRREGYEVGRDRVARLMAELGLCGATRTRKVRTTVPASASERPADLVERVFSADVPDRLWVADLTYVWTRAGFCYASFVIDAFSRRINLLQLSDRGVLQSQLLDRELFPTAAAADEALTRFALYSDYHRLNGAIGWQTPAERWDGTPFTDQGFEHVPALEHLQGGLTELMAA